MTTQTVVCAGRDIRVTTLDNGIRVITELMPHVRSVAVGVWVSSGSRMESKERNGISHFIEHMLFKGTANRSAEDIASEMDSLGGNMDAYTSRELVSYNAKVLDERLEDAFDVLTDLVRNPVFREEDLEREKGVILEEMKAEVDNPEYQVQDLFNKNFWGDHPLGWSIIGTKETVKSFDVETVRHHWRHAYVPENITVTAAGSLRHEYLVELTNQRLGALKPTGLKWERTVPQTNGFLKLENKPTLEQLHVIIGIPAYSLQHPRRFAAYTLATLLGGGMSSRLFQNIREKRGLAYAVFAELNLYRDTGTFQIYAGTSPETAAEVVQLSMAELRLLKDELVPAVELRRAKDHLKGATALGLESTGSRMANLARQSLFQDRFYSIDEMMDLIEAVTAEQIQEVARDCFQTDRLGIAILGRTDDVVIDPADLAL